MKNIIRTLVIFVLLSANVGCDQVSKNVIRSTVDLGERISLISNFMTLTKVENAGAFLSLGDSLPYPIKPLLLIIMPIIALLAIMIYLITKVNMNRFLTVGMSFIVGGGIGNLYDRVLYGSVTDFLHVDLVIFQTGIFNMADVSIMVGTFLILFSTFFQSEPENLIDDKIES